MRSAAEILESEKVLDKNTIESFMMQAKKYNKRIEEFLILKNVISDDVYLKIVSRKMNFKIINLDEAKIEPNAAQCMPASMEKKYTVFPFKIDKKYVYVAMHDPFFDEAFEYMRFATLKTPIVFLSSLKQIEHYISFYNDKRNVQDIISGLDKDKKTTEMKLSETVSNEPIVKVVNHMIEDAIDKNASDIHIEPFKDIFMIRLRIDGILHKTMQYPKDVYNLVCARIKVISSMDIAEKRIPQDGKINYIYNNKNYDIRVSSLPTIFGEKLELRILNSNLGKISIKNLCDDELLKLQLRKITKINHGMVIVTGPTGSGKTTTLYSILNELNKDEKNIVTIEDPVEYNIFGINQVNVNNKSGLTFAAGLKSILRQDPDAIMIGEIRDEETAQIAVRAAITGHLVLTTMHTNDASSSILRLINMGVPNYLAADAVSAVISQRLVRKICPDCKVSYIPCQNEIDELSLNGSEKLYIGKGCMKCSGTGYSGRTAIYEIMHVDETLRKYIRKNADVSEIKKQNINSGMVPLSDKLKFLVLRGITTYDEWRRMVSG